MAVEFVVPQLRPRSCSAVADPPRSRLAGSQILEVITRLHTRRVDRRKPLLLNRWEIAVDGALAEAAARCDVRVLAKVRLSSSLDLDRSGLSDDLFRYGTRAELDFVIADGANAQAQFAVEYDGPQHLTDPRTIRRDRMKSEICARLGLPLVRIGSEYLQRERRFTLIGYLVEMWSFERDFTAAQESGMVPFDEPFMPQMVIASSVDGPRDFPYWLERPARLRMVAVESAGKVVSRTPEELITPWPAHGNPDTAELVEAWAVLSLRPAGYIIGHAVLRNHPVFVPGITPRSLAADVAVADAGRQLDRWLRGDGRVVHDDGDLAALRRRTMGWISQGGHVPA
jgi:very-short-patch-repair endonuclease